jgi:hypothetical protein
LSRKSKISSVIPPLVPDVIESGDAAKAAVSETNDFADGNFPLRENLAAQKKKGRSPAPFPARRKLQAT